MRGTAKEQSPCLTPHPSLRDTFPPGGRLLPCLPCVRGGGRRGTSLTEGLLCPRLFIPHNASSREGRKPDEGSLRSLSLARRSLTFVRDDVKKRLPCNIPQKCVAFLWEPCKGSCHEVTEGLSCLRGAGFNNPPLSPLTQGSRKNVKRFCGTVARGARVGAALYFSARGKDRGEERSRGVQKIKNRRRETPRKNWRRNAPQ